MTDIPAKLNQLPTGKPLLPAQTPQWAAYLAASAVDGDYIRPPTAGIIEGQG